MRGLVTLAVALSVNVFGLQAWATHLCNVSNGAVKVVFWYGSTGPDYRWPIEPSGWFTLAKGDCIDNPGLFDHYDSDGRIIYSDLIFYAYRPSDGVEWYGKSTGMFGAQNSAYCVVRGTPSRNWPKRPTEKVCKAANGQMVYPVRVSPFGGYDNWEIRE